MSPAPDTEPVRIAVIGSGLAGLVTAHSLQTIDATRKDGTRILFEVELFEKSSALGMDSNSISIDLGDGSAPFRIDSPMRSVNGGSHSKLFNLYQHLDIALRRSDFSYSFSRLSRSSTASDSSVHSSLGSPSTPPPPPPYSCETPSLVKQDVKVDSRITATCIPSQHTRFIYEGSNGLAFPPLAFPSTISSASIFSRLIYVIDLIFLTLSYLHLLLLAFVYARLGLISRKPRRTRFTRLASRLGLRPLGNETVDEFCRRHFVSSRMKDEVLVPLYAAVSTVGRKEAKHMPVAECLDYIVSTFGASHYVADVGVQQVVRRLVAPLPLDHVHLSSTIISITPSSNSPSLLHLKLSSSPAPKPFHHVIFATQANQAAQLLPSAASLGPVLKALRAFTYTRSLVINHTDSSILPSLLRDRRDLNLVSFESARTPSERKEEENDYGSDNKLGASSIQATHILSRTHPRLLANSEVYQTTNPIVDIDSEKILSKAWYERVVVSKESKEVLGKFLLGEEGGGELQGINNVWFVGSWCAEGIPLLEGCVTSSDLVVDELARRHGASEIRRQR